MGVWSGRLGHKHIHFYCFNQFSCRLLVYQFFITKITTCIGGKWMKNPLIDWLGFNDTFSTNRLYCVFKKYVCCSQYLNSEKKWWNAGWLRRRRGQGREPKALDLDPFGARIKALKALNLHFVSSHGWISNQQSKQTTNLQSAGSPVQGERHGATQA